MTSSPTNQPESGFVTVAVVIEGSLVLLAVLGGLFAKRSPFAALHWHLEAVVVGLLAAVLCAGAMHIVYWSSWSPFASMRTLFEGQITPMFAPLSGFQLAAMAGMAGFAEELFFRGMLEPLLGDWTSPVLGMVIGAVIFGLCHALSKTYFALAAVASLLFSVLAVHNLLTAMIAHGFYDFLALMALRRWYQKTDTEVRTKDSR